MRLAEREDEVARAGSDRGTLTAEHRAAASLPEVDLRLEAAGEALAFAAAAPTPAAAPTRTAAERIVEALRRADAPLDYAALRAGCGMRNATLWACLLQPGRSPIAERALTAARRLRARAGRLREPGPRGPPSRRAPPR